MSIGTPIIFSCPTSGVAPVISIISRVNKMKASTKCYYCVLLGARMNYLIIIKYFPLFSPDFGSLSLYLE